MPLQETEIKNFLGISTKRTPQINECADCKDIEFRDTNGDMLSVVNPALLLNAPDFSSEGFTLAANLGFTTHVFSQLGGVSKEVTFYFQRGTVGSYPHIAIGMYPYYDAPYGSPIWTNGWKWLNKIIVTTISSHLTSSYYYYFTGLSGLSTVRFATVYNITREEWATITDAIAGTPGYYVLTRNDWNATDSVIIMSNYEPFGTAGAYYTAKSGIATADISFHKVLNELRVGFGSVINRLAIGIGYKKKYFQIDTLVSGDTLTNVTRLDDIILDPYNIISDAGTFSFGAVTFGDGQGLPGGYFPETFGKTFYLRMTAILDDYSEFVVVEQSNVYTGTKPIYSLQFQPLIRFATMNKRLTRIRVWLAGSGANGERSEDYKLVWEKDIAKSTPVVSGYGWTLASDGFLKLTNSASYMTITYSMYSGQTETQALRMTDALGYTPTTQYVSSWDQALVTGNATYLLNPYIDKTWKNFIFNSPISGAGAAQYDVITAENYRSLDTRDGNDIIGITLNSNMEYTIFRTNGYQQYDPINQVASQVINGIGISSTRLGIVNQNNAIFFPSQFDYYVLQGNQNQNLSEDTIRDAYRALTKTNILGGKENYGQSIIFYSPEEGKWYTFTPGKGWTIRNLTSVVYFGNTFDGKLLFINGAGNFYRIDPLEATHTATTNLYWISVPIDIALLGDGITSDDRFIVSSIWIKYSSAKALTAQISYDGGIFTDDRIFPIKTSIGTVERRFTPGKNCKFFQLKISGTMNAGDARMRISAIGIRWQMLKTGLFR